MDFNALLFAPIYAAFGTSATFVTEDGTVFVTTGIDKSSGVAVEAGAGEYQTLRPAVVVRMSDVTDAGLTVESFDGASLTMNGKTWRVDAAQPRPTPMGEGDGELYCYLSEVTE